MFSHPEPKMIWTGLHPNLSSKELLAHYKNLKSKGLTGIFLGGYSKEEAQAIREAELDLHTWMWTLNRNEPELRTKHPEWFQVSRTGKSCATDPPYVDYYRWLSPVIPGVRDYLKDRVGEITEREEVQGVHLDYVRYPDVILPEALWATYGLDQREEMAEYDFCYGEATRKAFKEQTGRDPLEIKDPSHDQEWLHFRYDSVTNVVRELTQVAHQGGKVITAAIFPTPRMARKICRQDWDKWPLDAACPMIYNSFYNKPAEWVGEMVLENIQTVKFPVIAGLYMPAFETPDQFKTALQTARKRGAKGVSLFGDITDAQWTVFEEWIGEAP